MRVIGGRDYYDGATAFDTDEARIFIRHDHSKTDSVKITEFKQFYRRLRISNGVFQSTTSDDYRCIAVIFAGKIYNFVLYSKLGYPYNAKAEELIWDKASLLASLDKRNVRLTATRKNLWQPDQRDVTRADLDDFFEPKLVPKDVMDYLIDNGIVVAIRRSVIDRYTHDPDGNWFINTDGLKNYHFGSKIDPWTANQEIDMFLGTILVRDEDKQVQISDASKVRKHGFDKWSFRNQRHRGKPRRSA